MAMAHVAALVIDGSLKEGGGQILRNASSLSCLLGIPINIINIRAKRSKPGLRPQHLIGLQLIRDLCHGRLEGDSEGSSEITLYPSNVQSGNFIGDTKTAGSVTLLIQSVLPCLLFSPGPSTVSLKGGTNVDMAPQIDFLTMVFQPVAELFGIKFGCDIKRRGYYPRGGGEVHLKLSPIQQVTPVQLIDPGNLTRIVGRAYVAGSLPVKIAHTMARVATAILQRRYREVDVLIEAIQEPRDKTTGNGCGIIVMAETSTGCRLSGSALGRKGIPAEDVATIAAEELLRSMESKSCVDDHLQDQLIILMALAAGKSQIKTGPLTLHTETAIHIAQILTKVNFKTIPFGNGSNSFLIECEGIGLKNKYTS